MSRGQGINTPTSLSSLLQVSSASRCPNTARSQGSSGHIGHLLQSPSRGKRLVRGPGWANGYIWAGETGKKLREVSGWENVTSSGVARHSEEKSGESWIREGKDPQQFDQVPLSPPALHIQVGTDVDKEAGMGAFASLSCGTHFPLCPGGRQTAASGWGGCTWTPSPHPSQSGPWPFPQSWGWGSFISPLASGWPGQQQLCLMLSGLPGCDKRQMGL